MELADGSLRKELDKPENCFGLPYEMLFTIISHLGALFTLNFSLNFLINYFFCGGVVVAVNRKAMFCIFGFCSSFGRALNGRKAFP